MKLTTGVVVLAIMTGSAMGQNPGIIQRTKNALMGVHQQQSAASNTALQGTAPAKPSGAVASKPTAAPQPAPAAAAVKPVSTKPAAQPAPKPTQPVKPVVTSVKTPAAPKAAVTMKQAAAPKPAAKASPMTPKVAAHAAAAVPASAAEAKASGESAPKADKREDKKYAMTGKRDPFVSPVVNRAMGSGCSTGKKCLDIEQIALHGVVKSDNGMIAVVTNGLNKAYFLRENDPVFNGYVVKITGDSIVFKQNFQDRLGKPFTKDVVKRITTPAV
jgi:Tfp pilus assembly protein PilP